MQVLHHGFDKLEFSIKTKTSRELRRRLAGARNCAEAKRQSQPIELAGLAFVVEPDGMRGGYRFRLTRRGFDHFVAIKDTEGNDDWCVSVSVGALPLALDGFEACHQRVMSELAKIGIYVAGAQTSVRRVDYAVDLLFDQYTISHEKIVYPPRSSWLKHETERTQGSGREVVGLTLGKTPGAQLAIYNKGREVVQKRLRHWPEIWNSVRKQSNQSLLELPLMRGQIWRFELRAGKLLLNKRHRIRTCEEVMMHAQKIFSDLASQIRVVCPGRDGTRSRWPDSPEWTIVRTLLAREMETMAPEIDQERLRIEKRNDTISALDAQITGAAIALGVLQGATPDNAQKLPAIMGAELRRLLEDVGDGLEQRVNEVIERYRHLL